jgi:hypothetical protein
VENKASRLRRIDFAIRLQLDSSNQSFRSLHLFGSRDLIIAMRREAGGNPALPRNCKRGHASGHWESLGRPVAATDFDLAGRETYPSPQDQNLTRQPGDRREPPTPTLSRVKEE